MLMQLALSIKTASLIFKCQIKNTNFYCDFSERVGSQPYTFTSTYTFSRHNIATMWWALSVDSTCTMSEKPLQSQDLYLWQWCYTQKLWEAPNPTKCQFLHYSALTWWGKGFTFRGTEITYCYSSLTHNNQICWWVCYIGLKMQP